MPLDATEKKKRFNDLCGPIEKKVLEMHRPFPYPADWKSVSSDALLKWVRQPTDWEGVGKSALKAFKNLPTTIKEKAIPFLLGRIPFVGGGLSALAEKAVAYCKGKGHEASLSADPKAKPDFLVERGMASYVEAIRKVSEAGQEVTEATSSFKCCSDFETALKRFYYWKYRLERLRYYHDLVSGFCNAVEEEIASSAASVKQMEEKLAAELPKYMFENIEWHVTLCKDKCFYPFDKAEISGPMNVQFNRGPVLAGPNASLKPVPMVPTKATPPVPPRNHPQHATAKPLTFPKK